MSNRSVLALSEQPSVVDSAERFAFGRNWRKFLSYLTDERIAEAEKSLRSMLEVESLAGKSFLDIGCGSGLFSLAAMRLGAEKVHSFDLDMQSVSCTRELKRRYFDGVRQWTIQQGSVLDSAFLAALGQFDVVYSWGVLHHTGKMWQALENVVPLVNDGGKWFLALYNDQGFVSKGWKAIKERYSRGLGWRLLIVPFFFAYFGLRGFAKDVLILRKNPFSRYREYKQGRGMAYTTDMLDWLGGYPFEVAKPDAVFDFFRAREFELVKLTTAGGGRANNQFVFINRSEQVAS